MLNRYIVKNKSVYHLLLDTKGDTIVEALVAILVSSLASVMLAGAVSASRNLIVASKNALESYYSANNNLANHANHTSTTAEPPVLKLDGETIDSFGGTGTLFYVNDRLHSRDKMPVVSYELKP